jgi:hypothetical protein
MARFVDIRAHLFAAREAQLDALRNFPSQLPELLYAKGSPLRPSRIGAAGLGEGFRARRVPPRCAVLRPEMRSNLLFEFLGFFSPDDADFSFCSYNPTGNSVTERIQKWTGRTAVSLQLLNAIVS